MPSPQEQAAHFLGHAKLVAVGLWEPVSKQQPHLWQAIAERGRTHLTFDEKCFKWDFLHIVAMTWWAIQHATATLPPDEWELAAATLDVQVAEWNAGAHGALADLARFVSMHEQSVDSFADVPAAVAHTKRVVGTWLLWNLTNKATFADEAELASMLGHVVYQCVDGYWEL